MRTSHTPLKLRRQTGVAMVIVLMFLVAVISIGIFSARYATMGEGIARNQFDYELARQAAEAALRDAERDLMINEEHRPSVTPACARVLGVSTESRFDEQCTQGLCIMSEDSYKKAVWNGPKETAEPWWPEKQHGKWNNDFDTKPSASNKTCSFTGAVPLGTFTGMQAIGGVIHQPEYLIELFKRDRKYFYRITARGFGSSENTQVVLQSFFQPPAEITGSGT